MDTCPSPVISLFFNSSVVHLTLDCGAEANCITESECKRLKIKVKPAGQLASQIDNSSINVIGEIHVSFTRGSLSFRFDALVVPNINKASILAGMPFLKTNMLTVPFFEDYVKVQNKYKIPVTPSVFIDKHDKCDSHSVKVRQMTLPTPGNVVCEGLPDDLPNLTHTDTSNDSDLQSQIYLTECNPEKNVIRKADKFDISIKANKEEKPSLSSKLPEINEHIPNVFEEPTEYVSRSPESYLSLIKYDPDGIVANLPNGQETLNRLKRANAEYHEVFNGDLTLGYNGASGPCKANWDFIQEPPTNHGKSASYIKDEQKHIAQAKIDRLYNQKVIQKPSELGVVVKMVNPVMILKKAEWKTVLGRR